MIPSSFEYEMLGYLSTSWNDHNLRCDICVQKSSLLAQLVERETVNLEVSGSIPLQRDYFCNTVFACCCCFEQNKSTVTVFEMIVSTFP